MPSKWMRRALLLFAVLTGFVLGYLRPAAAQGMLSITGIVAGLGFFFLSRRTTDDNSKKEETFDRWYILIQMLIYFIIGGALGSMIPMFRTIYG